jgi:hypothetical protein
MDRERLAKVAKEKRLAEEAEKNAVEASQNGRGDEIEEGGILDGRDSPSLLRMGERRSRKSFVSMPPRLQLDNDAILHPLI